jgi:hypothetical protein
VLDKINVKGINALDDIDKDVLAKGWKHLIRMMAVIGKTMKPCCWITRQQHGFIFISVQEKS